MTFNNTTNEAKIYLNGGEQIELVGQKPASGIWFKNDHYELRGKGESVELTKDGKTVFKNQNRHYEMYIKKKMTNHGERNQTQCQINCLGQ